MEFDVPNMDGMDASELSVLSLVLEELSCYARLKCHAMEKRAAGEITLALQHEGNCEEIYNQLPQWAKW